MNINVKVLNCAIHFVNCEYCLKIAFKWCHKNVNEMTPKWHFLTNISLLPLDGKIRLILLTASYSFILNPWPRKEYKIGFNAELNHINLKYNECNFLWFTWSEAKMTPNDINGPCWPPKLQLHMAICYRGSTAQQKHFQYKFIIY